MFDLDIGETGVRFVRMIIHHLLTHFTDLVLFSFVRLTIILRGSGAFRIVSFLRHFESLGL